MFSWNQTEQRVSCPQSIALDQLVKQIFAVATLLIAESSDRQFTDQFNCNVFGTTYHKSRKNFNKTSKKNFNKTSEKNN